MKKFLPQPIRVAINFVIGIAVGLLVARTLAGVVRSDDRASISITAVKPLVYDAENEWASAKITLRNNGSRRMVAKVTEPDCDCSIRTDELRIKPGEERVLEFAVGSNSIRFAKTLRVDILTNDPEKPRLPVTVQVLGGEENDEPDDLPVNAKSVLVIPLEAH